MDETRIQKFSRTLSFPCFLEKTEDLFYLTGLAPSKGRLFVSPSEAYLYVDGRYYEEAKTKASCPVFLWEEQGKKVASKMGFDSEAVSYDGYLALKKGWPETEWIPLSQPLKQIRAIKEKQEIEALRKAALLTWQGYQHIRSLLKEGIQESELAWEFEVFCRKRGASGLSFAPIIAFGANGAYPHYRAGKTRLEPHQMVLIDVGAVVDGYHGDMTRMVHFGQPDSRLLHLEQIVRRVQQKAIDAVRPGVKVGHLDALVREEFAKEKVLDKYLHSLGHGVGLETHEFPRILAQGKDQETLLQPGMIFTIEPGLYELGLGGIRLEEMVLVTDTFHECLFPKETSHA